MPKIHSILLRLTLCVVAGCCCKELDALKATRSAGAATLRDARTEFTTAGCPASLTNYFEAWRDRDPTKIGMNDLTPGFVRRGGKLGTIDGTTPIHGNDRIAELKRQLGESTALWATYQLELAGNPACDNTVTPREHKIPLRFTGTMNTKLTSARPRALAPTPDCTSSNTSSCTCNCAPLGPPPEADWPAGPTHQVTMEFTSTVHTNAAGQILDETIAY